MSESYLFAKCRCGFRTPIQPSMTGIEAKDQKWRETGNDLPYVACEECKRIYEPLERDILPLADGLSPYRQDAPLRVFRVSIPCEEHSCGWLQAIAVRNSNTTDEEIDKEKAQWRGRALRCSQGHLQNVPSGWE